MSRAIISDEILPADVFGVSLLCHATGAFATGVNSYYVINADGSTSAISVSSAIMDPLMFSLRAADLARVGRTAKLRLDMILLTNSVAPAITITPALLQVTAGGGSAAQLNPTYALALSGTAIVSPAANSKVQSSLANLTPPADGEYALGFLASGTAAANAKIGVSVRALAYLI